MVIFEQQSPPQHFESAGQQRLPQHAMSAGQWPVPQQNPPGALQPSSQQRLESEHTVGDGLEQQRCDVAS